MADNLTYGDIISRIESNDLKSLYVFWGPEDYLISDVLRRIEEKVINPSLKNLNYIKLDGRNIGSDDIINACETLPFMDDRRLVVVYDCTFFKGNKQKDGEDSSVQIDELCVYLSQKPDTSILIFIGGDEVDRRKKLYGCIKEKGDIISCDPMKGIEMVRWIIDAFHKMGITISRADAAYFAERVQGNLGEVLNEINKACSYVGSAAVVSRADIENVTPKSLEAGIFKLVDHISKKEPGPALSILNELLFEGEPLQVILAMIIRQYRLLLAVGLLYNKGYNASEIAGKLSIKPFIVPNLIKLLGFYPEGQIQMRLERCLDMDCAMKSGMMDPRVAIETLIVEFAQ